MVDEEHFLGLLVGLKQDGARELLPWLQEHEQPRDEGHVDQVVVEAHHYLSDGVVWLDDLLGHSEVAVRKVLQEVLEQVSAQKLILGRQWKLVKK